MPTAPLSPFAHSSWIWPLNHHWNIQNGYALFRKTFTLGNVPASAPLFITADQAYRLWVNGSFVGRGPARGFQRSWPYDEIDISPYLRTGENLIAVRAYNPGFSNFQYVSQGFAGLLVSGCWGSVEVHSDETWQCLRQQGIKGDAYLSSMQLFPQEHIDLREEPVGWQSLAEVEGDWRAPITRPWNSAPWYALESRDIPLLREELWPVAPLIGMGEGACAEGYRETNNIVATRVLEDRSHQSAGGEATTVAVEPTGTGRFRSFLFDSGKTVVGSLVVTVKGAQGGEIIDTHLTETIDEDSLTLDQKMDAHCRMAFGDRLVCRPGEQTHSFFHHYGFRFLEVTVRDAEAQLELELKLNWVGYPMERKGSFYSSDKELEAIWETCAWTQQCCMLDAYVDTPWREQAQWWGDARVQAWNTFHLNGDTRLFRRGIKQIGSQQTEDGVTYGHAPTMAHNCILPDFTLIWFITLWDYYWQTGETEALLAHHEQVQRALNYFRDWTDPQSGLLTYDDRYWLFLDWTGIFKDGTPTLYNLWLLIALDKLVELYRVAERPADAEPLEKWAAELRGALGELVGKDGFIRDGIDRQGKRVESTCLHNQVLALYAGLDGVSAEVAEEKLLLPFIRREWVPEVHPSAYWITYVFSYLIKAGYEEEVLAYIKERWQPMVGHGTTWENFEPVIATESFSHAWSAHPLFHCMATVGGVRQAAPTWKRILFRPVFHGDTGGAVIPSPHGLIESSWERLANEKIHVTLRLPEGVEADVSLSGLAPEVVSGSREWDIALMTA